MLFRPWKYEKLISQCCKPAIFWQILLDDSSVATLWRIRRFHCIKLLDTRVEKVQVLFIPQPFEIAIYLRFIAVIWPSMSWIIIISIFEI